jgi:hypothetical protein
VSVVTFIRDGADCRCSPPSAPVIVVGHGGGGVRFGAAHPLVTWARQRAPVVHSLQLPLPGSDARTSLGVPFDTLADKQSSVPAVLLSPLLSSPLLSAASVAPCRCGLFDVSPAYAYGADAAWTEEQQEDGRLSHRD